MQLQVLFGLLLIGLLSGVLSSMAWMAMFAG
jgi:hypothetical protein